MTGDRDQSNKRWIEEAEDALNRTTEALRAAWDESREARMSTLEAAREAANRLGTAIDQGIEAAKQSWGPGQTPDLGEADQDVVTKEEE